MWGRSALRLLLQRPDRRRSHLQGGAAVTHINYLADIQGLAAKKAVNAFLQVHSLALEKVLQSEASKKLLSDNDLWTAFLSGLADKELRGCRRVVGKKGAPSPWSSWHDVWRRVTSQQRRSPLASLATSRRLQACPRLRRGSPVV